MQLLLVCGRDSQLWRADDLHPVHGFAGRHWHGAAPRVLVLVKLKPPLSACAPPDALRLFRSGASRHRGLG